MFRLGKAISILARSTREPSGILGLHTRKEDQGFSSATGRDTGCLFPAQSGCPDACGSRPAQIVNVGLARLDQLPRAQSWSCWK